MIINEIFKTPSIDYNFDEIYQKCSIAINQLKKGFFIYRGDLSNQVIKHGTSLKGIRTSSAAKSNGYTVWIDNNPSWSQFPKRSKSFICSTDKVIASAYTTHDRYKTTGSIYLVLPEDNPLIGICPSSDIQASTEYGYELYDLTFLRFNTFLDYIYYYLKNNQKDERKIFRKYDEIIDLLHLFDNYPDKTSKEYQFVIYWSFGSTRNAEKLSPIIPYIEEAFDPDKNGFSISKLSNISPIKGSKEIWFSGSAYFININNSLYKKFLEDIQISS